jgi:hypothetical protein
MPSPRFAFTRCPKCRHSPLPKDQRLPAACPACGVVLAKLVAAPDAPVRPTVAIHEIADDEKVRWSERLFAPAEPTDPSMLWLRSALWLAFAAWGVDLIRLDYKVGEIAGSFLHAPLLVFHEAGHFVFRLGGEWLMVLGGTLGQLIMPALMMAALLAKNRDAFGAALAFWLFGVSLLDIAPYAYDALEPRLMLLSGQTGEDGPHDWIYLLGSVHRLHSAHGIGAFFHTLGAMIVLAAVGWSAWLLLRQWTQRLREAPIA